MTNPGDRIVKEITLKAPRTRVWRALTDSAEFGAWFRARFEGPFVVGEQVRGTMTHPACEGAEFETLITQMDAEHAFALRWHPYPVEPTADFSSEPTTLVEFHLEDAGDGTKLTLTESGFDALPEHRRVETFRLNERGWAEQMGNIERHVDG